MDTSLAGVQSHNWTQSTQLLIMSNMKSSSNYGGLVLEVVGSTVSLDLKPLILSVQDCDLV